MFSRGVGRRSGGEEMRPSRAPKGEQVDRLTKLLNQTTLKFEANGPAFSDVEVYARVKNLSHGPIVRELDSSVHERTEISALPILVQSTPDNMSAVDACFTMLALNEPAIHLGSSAVIRSMLPSSKKLEPMIYVDLTDAEREKATLRDSLTELSLRVEKTFKETLLPHEKPISALNKAISTDGFAILTLTDETNPDRVRWTMAHRVDSLNKRIYIEVIDPWNGSQLILFGDRLKSRLKSSTVFQIEQGSATPLTPFVRNKVLSGAPPVAPKPIFHTQEKFTQDHVNEMPLKTIAIAFQFLTSPKNRPLSLLETQEGVRVKSILDSSSPRNSVVQLGPPPTRARVMADLAEIEQLEESVEFEPINEGDED